MPPHPRMLSLSVPLALLMALSAACTASEPEPDADTMAADATAPDTTTADSTPPDSTAPDSAAPDATEDAAVDTLDTTADGTTAPPDAETTAPDATADTAADVDPRPDAEPIDDHCDPDTTCHDGVSDPAVRARYYDAPDTCERCPLAGTFDGAACLVATAPRGATAFVYDGQFYMSPQPDGSCPAGTSSDTQNCHLGPVPAGATGYAFDNKLYVTPACCPCPERGYFDGANCFVAEAPAGSAPFIYDDQFYYAPDAANTCASGTFDGSHCTVGHNPGGSEPFLIGRQLYLANACAHTTPDPSTAATIPTNARPPVGELCAPGFYFDGAHCKLGVAPAGTTAFNTASRFYHSLVPNQPIPALWQSGGACPAPALYDGANCERHIVPGGYTAFIYQNAWFTDINPNLVFHSQGCPAGFTYDGAHCFLGKAPDGRTASVRFNRFVFDKPLTQSCSSLYPGSSIYLVAWCQVADVPDGYDAFVYDNGWYMSTTPGTPGTWFTRHYGPDTNPDLVRPVCLADDAPSRTWHMLWGDEFGDAPDGDTCYTADDRMTCVTEPYWGEGVCADSPTAWDASSRATWGASQHARYDGLVNLDKCHWQLMDSYNTWSGEGGTDAYNLDAVRVEDGMMRLRNYARPGAGPFDCGRNKNQTGDGAPDHTKNCPYIGANVVTSTWNPWLVQGGHSPDNADPNKRYVGRAVGPGRIEFRARIASLGHGAWPSLWLFSDHLLPGSGEQHNGELDALEFLADQNGPADELTSGRATYGMAWQTGHDWAPGGDVSDGTGIPISVGAWHLYAVEWDDNAMRYYIDGCLRHMLRDGQQVKNPWTGVVSTFHIPRDTTYNILISTPASNTVPAAWGKASVDANGNPRADFMPSAMDVDYVRYYVRVGQ